jgi:hypothetical protein
MYALIVDVGENSYVEHMADVDTMDQWEQRLNKKFPRLKFYAECCYFSEPPNKQRD